MNILVVFYSIGGRAERAALATGVGAIQGHGSIRLRRLSPDTAVDGDQLTPSERENFNRMPRDYTAPRREDAEWADALILAASTDGVSHVERYLEQLAPVTEARKIAAPVIVDQAPEALRRLYAAAAAAGLVVLPTPSNPLASVEAGHAFGRRVVALAKAIKDVH